MNEHLSLSQGYFFWTALALHLTILAISVSLNNLDFLYLFTGAFGTTATMFLFPGLLYILALRKYARSSHYQRWSTISFIVLACLFLALSAVVSVSMVSIQLSKAFD